MSSNWFDIDKAGLAAILERRGKHAAIFELISNSFDATATRVEVTLEPANGVPFVHVTVEDNSPAGWGEHLHHAHTMFAPSQRGQHAERRGRFNLGEKLAIACCRHVRLETMDGTIIFDDKGRHQKGVKRERGTMFTGEMRMTRDEMGEAIILLHSIIPPTGVELIVNGEHVDRPILCGDFRATLPTEIAGPDGLLKRTTRACKVEAFYADAGGVLEMGIPVCEVAEWPWRLNVLQKVPLGFERDTITDAMRRALLVAAVNALPSSIRAENASEPWVEQAISDSRISPTAVATAIEHRFGPRAVVASPFDPIANATAEAAGYTVVHGGSLSSGTWANVRKIDGILPAASKVFPTATAEERAKAAAARGGTCPMCGSQMKPAGG